MIHIQEWFAGACIVFLFVTGWFCGKEHGWAEGYKDGKRRIVCINCRKVLQK